MSEVAELPVYGSEAAYLRRDHETLARDAARQHQKLTMLWRWYDNLAQWTQVSLTCEYCGSGPGEYCVVRKSGKRATQEHSSRWRQMAAIRGDWDDR